MDPRRLSGAEWIAGIGAVLLLVSLFLPWYFISDVHATAWETMAVNDVLIMIAAAFTLTAVVWDGSSRAEGRSVVGYGLASAPALLALILVVWRMLDPAPDADVSLGPGAWLGLTGALAMFGGVMYSMRDQGPARRNAEIERAVAAAEMEHAELLPLGQNSEPSDPAERGS